MLARLPARLNPRWEMFCAHYAVSMNGTAAAIEAGYSPASANVQAAQLLARSEIKERVAQLMKKRSAAVVATQERVIQELSAIAFSNAKELYDEHGRLKPIHELEDHVAATISSIEEERRIEGRGDDAETVYTKKVKSWDKMKALEMLAKYFKMYTDAAATNVNIDQSTKVLSVNDLRSLPAEEQSLLRQLAESRARRSEADAADAGPDQS